MSMLDTAQPNRSAVATFAHLHDRRAHGRAAALLSTLLTALIVALASPVSASAQRFALAPAIDGTGALTVTAAPPVEDLTVMQEILDDTGRVVDVAELTHAAARTGDGLEIRWRPARAEAVADGPASVRFFLSGTDPASGDGVVEMHAVAATVTDGVAALVTAPERIALERSLWHPDDTVLEPGAADAAADGPTAKGAIALPPPPDPTTRTSYGCYYIQNYNWNYGGDGVPTVVGKIRWPSATCSYADGPPSNRPMVIFMHGRGMDHVDHDYLMAHLAKNGFVAASIANGAFDDGSNEGRARQAISYLNGMHAYWGWSHRLSDRVVFAGHSRGGEAAVTAARLLDETPALGHEDYDVRAVISIAPTDGGGGDGNFPHEELLGSAADGFLGIYGSKDGDVTGAPIAPWPTEPEHTVFAIYDRAGSELSSEGIQLFGVHLTKAMAFVDGATHSGFKDADACGLTLPLEPMCSDHRNVARAYFNAFLRWHVFDQTDHRGFFDGTWRPPALSGLGIAQQYSGGVRRVIDNFEQPGWSSSTIGGSVLQGTGIVVLAEDDLIDLDAATPHATRGMRIKWGGAGTRNVRWHIPDESPLWIGPLRDFSGYDYLSLRAGQTYDDAWNTVNQPQDFHLRLYTSQGWSNKVPVSAYGELAYPDSYGKFPDDFSKTTMETIRVPLSAFTDADLTDVRWVTLYFDVPGHDAGSVQIDSLELAH